MDEISLTKVSELAKEIIEIRKRRDELEDELAEVNRQRTSLEMKMAEFLEALGTNNQKFHDFKFIRAERVAVANPQTVEDTMRFHKWLQERGEAHLYLTVNAQTLSSQYKKWVAELAENCPDGEITIPGLPEPRLTPYLQVKKA